MAQAKEQQSRKVAIVWFKRAPSSIYLGNAPGFPSYMNRTVGDFSNFLILLENYYILPNQILVVLAINSHYDFVDRYWG